MGISSRNNLFITVAVVVALTGAGYYILSKPDQRNSLQKVSDAINELPNGAEKASRQLESRTPGDKLKDVVSDAKDDIKKATNTP